MECIRAVDIALKAERLILGEPTERTATDVEANIRREHVRWLDWTQPGRDGNGADD